MCQPRKRRRPCGREPSSAQVLAALVTERPDPRYENLDTLGTRELVRLIHRESRRVWTAVEAVLPQVARLADWVAEAFRRGGRLVFVGAGTSGRLGVMEAAECPPTFGTPPRQVVGIIAGGRRTLVRSREGVEDQRAPARREIRRLGVGPEDVVVGLAASRRTPFVQAALAEARRRGARTALIHTNPPGPGEEAADLVIRPQVGPEVLAGSTRMKSGTAQKLILNMVTTAAMIRTGRAFGNLMVDLRAASLKLRERSVRLVRQTTGLDRPQAQALLRRAGGRVKVAILMGRTGMSRRQAQEALERAGGFLRKALEAAGADPRPFPRGERR
jgi:N-acetylmuramic acid 6-phosphate etherase